MYLGYINVRWEAVLIVAKHGCYQLIPGTLSFTLSLSRSLFPILYFTLSFCLSPFLSLIRFLGFNISHIFPIFSLTFSLFHSYFSPSFSLIHYFSMRAGIVARMEEGRSAFKILTGKPTGKRPLGKPRRRWEDNIRIDLEELGTSTRIWVDSAQDTGNWRVLVNGALNLLVP